MANEDKFSDEMLTDEQLDEVSGGGTAQTIGDFRFVRATGFIHRLTETQFGFILGWRLNAPKVDGGWAKAGVTCCTVFGSGDNKYWIGGKEVTRKEAFAHVLRQKGYSEDAIAKYNYNQWPGEF